MQVCNDIGRAKLIRYRITMIRQYLGDVTNFPVGAYLGSKKGWMFILAAQTKREPSSSPFVQIGTVLGTEYDRLISLIYPIAFLEFLAFLSPSCRSSELALLMISMRA